MGIGLSVCKRLVASMGGQIWSAPRADGGSVFSFSLRTDNTPPSEIHD
jgi:two-component system sensor kinase FixL